MFQCKSSWSITSKYWTWEDGSIFWPAMWKLRCLVMVLFLDLNITISVLLVFNNNLLALIQLKVSFKSLLICLYFLRELSMRSKLVSSAKWLNSELNFAAWFRSLINKMKRRGSCTDPFGTPYFTICLLDLLPGMVVYYFLPCRKEFCLLEKILPFTVTTIVESAKIAKINYTCICYPYRL